ncbi:immunoglobulin-like domain-containing protein, partial [Agathobacter rectalis]|uniref:immunoglobulin-like domain-containing protein n=2 Tax=Bacillota TaxID=1239 RepID=UPI0027D266A0
LAKAYNGEIILVSENDIVENTVDPNTEGSYKVVYQVRDRFGKASEKVERLVIVQNHAPVLHGIKDLSFHVGTNITLDD